jgi:hypothetical protein
MISYSLIELKKSKGILASFIEYFIYAFGRRLLPTGKFMPVTIHNERPNILL